MNECVIVWTRLGPYHLARISGAAKRLRCAGLEVTAIEVAGRDHYLWEASRSEPDSRRRTLFPEAQYCDLTQKEVGGRVTSALEEIKPDAVAINGWAMPEARAALSWCRENERIAVLMSETKEDECKRRWWKEWLKSRIVRRFDAALVGGRPHKEYAVKLGVPAEKVFLGYDAVDNDYFIRQTEKVRSGRDSAAPPDETLRALRPYFYANSRFLHRKNLDGLLRAYHTYRERAAEPWNLVITGDGEERENLLRLCADLGLPMVDQFKARPESEHGSGRAAPAVLFPGFVQYEQLPVYYALASAFIHPARSEPWGLVVNEACASGLPVLVSHTVGSRYELVQDPQNGYLLDPFEVEDICSRMLRLSDLPAAERRQMGERSRRIVADWGPERFGQGLWRAIQAAEAG